MEQLKTVWCTGQGILRCWGKPYCHTNCVGRGDPIIVNCLHGVYLRGIVEYRRPVVWLIVPLNFLLMIGLFSFASGVRFAEAEDLSGYNYFVSSFVGTEPAPNTRFTFYDNKEAPTDSLTLVTDAFGNATYFAGLSGVGDQVPHAPSSLGRAYPNPSNGSAHLKHFVSSDKDALETRIVLYGLKGEKIAELGLGENRFDRDLAAGVYVVKDLNSGDSSKLVSLGGFSRLVLNEERILLEPSSAYAKVAQFPMNADLVVTNETQGRLNFDNVELKPPTDVNEFNVNYENSGYPFTKNVAFQVRSIAGDNRQAIGEIVLRNATGEEFIAVADGDSVYRTTVGVDSEGEELTIWPRNIPGYESMTYTILDPDSVAVRGVIADAAPMNYPQFPDTARVAFDTAALDKELFLEIIPEYRMADGQFRQSVGVIFKRYYDRNVEIWTNTEESNFTVPAPQYAIDWLIQAEQNLINMFENTPDSIPLINSTLVILPSESGNYDNVAVRYIDNYFTPNNDSFDLSGDGFLDYHYATIRNNDGLGTASVEIANEFAHDLVSGTLGNLINPITFEYNLLGKDVAATWAKFSNGRNFNPSLKS